MRCKFIDHGVQIYYAGLVKPCCALQTEPDYQMVNHISRVDLVTWHQSHHITKIRQQLEQDQWPRECSRCEQIESQGRGDSIRLSGEQAYSHYLPGDITLEIRPGNTCNFACQTCWPQASSRVANYYRRAGIGFDSDELGDWSYKMIEPVLDRVRDIIILGGEPFYDKKCVQFLRWLMQQRHHPRVTMFTNGSMVDLPFLTEYSEPITLVFSLDACGRPAEYIRVGTEWETVLANYEMCRTMPKVNVRVNITMSPYNYPYITELLTMLTKDWPEVVSWGIASQNTNSRFMSEAIIPMHYREQVISYLEPCLQILEQADIERYQKINSQNAVQSIINNLRTVCYDETAHQRMKDFVRTMDRVKNMQLEHYCPEVSDYLDIRADMLAKDSPTFFMSDITASRD